MGNTSKPQEAFNSGDVVTLTSLAEGFPYSVIEAMACGKAIVATDVGGVSEALEGVGLLARSRHPKEIADGILNLLHDDLLRKKFEKAAIKKVFEKFTVSQSVEEFRKCYNELISLNEKKRVNKQLTQEVVLG
jgi:glycosyltransferase involved in cell wall biosynthesis